MPALELQSAPSLIRCALGDEEVDIDRQLLAVPVSPVLGLPNQSHLLRQLHKDNSAGSAEVQASAYISGASLLIRSQ